jgi:hypothetical protein
MSFFILRAVPHCCGSSHSISNLLAKLFLNPASLPYE